jgi:dihydroorotate dehydrogenase electron transfer subunit
MRYQLDAPILSHQQVGDCEYELTARSREIACEARPGQFLQIRYDDTLNPYSRRPFSVFRVDLERETFSIVYLARGAFTQGLRGKRPGDKLSVVGPLGNSFSVAEETGGRHVLVAGGVGAPPMYLLAWDMARRGFPLHHVTIINGARTRGLLVALHEMEALGVDLRVTTDDGSVGRHGLVTDELAAVLAGREPMRVYACGPTAMLRAVGDECVRRGVSCQVSVETVMPCGVGVCMGCVVKIRDASSPSGFAYQRSCQDGPVFEAAEVIWE